MFKVVVMKTDHKGSESDVSKQMSKEEFDPGKNPAAGGSFLFFLDRDFPGNNKSTSVFD